MVARLGFVVRPFGNTVALCICRETTLETLFVMLFRDEAACLEALVRCGLPTTICSTTYVVVSVEMEAFASLLHELGGLAGASSET